MVKSTRRILPTTQALPSPRNSILGSGKYANRCAPTVTCACTFGLAVAENAGVDGIPGASRHAVLPAWSSAQHSGDGKRLPRRIKCAEATVAIGLPQRKGCYRISSGILMLAGTSPFHRRSAGGGGVKPAGPIRLRNLVCRSSNALRVPSRGKRSASSVAPAAGEPPLTRRALASHPTISLHVQSPCRRPSQAQRHCAPRHKVSPSARVVSPIGSVREPKIMHCSHHPLIEHRPNALHGAMCCWIGIARVRVVATNPRSRQRCPSRCSALKGDSWSPQGSQLELSRIGADCFSSHLSASKSSAPRRLAAAITND